MLPETGSISMSQVNVELKKGETTVITLNDANVRKLAGKPSGVISMNDLRGKKASEYVESYQIYSNSWSGTNDSGNFKIIFPHKVISGNILVSSSFNVFEGSNAETTIGYINILNQKIQQTSKSINISNLKEVNGSYFTGQSKAETSHGNVIHYGEVSINIKFTGEWEA